MLVNKEDYKEVVRRFVGEYFPNSSAVMLTGSYVSDYFNEYSDLDVIILSKWHCKTFVESYEYEQIKIQIIALPLVDVHGVLIRDYMSRNGAIISMLSKGIILYDPNSYMKRLQGEVEGLLKQKRIVAKDQMDMERSKLTTIYEDICGLSDRDELLFSVVDAMPKILNMYFLVNGALSYHGKSAIRELKSTNDCFWKKYAGAIDYFFRKGDKSKVVDLLCEVLETAGGKLHYHTSKKYKNVIDSDDIVIYISPRGNDHSLEILYRVEYAFHKFIDRRIKSLKYLSFVNRYDGLFGRGLYILINSKKQVLNDEILPIIHQFHYGNPVSVSSGLIECWNYPYAYNPLQIRGIFSQYIFDTLHIVARDKYVYRDKEIIQYSLDVMCCISESANVKHIISPRNLWKRVFEIFLLSHSNKMMPTETIELVNDLKRRKLYDDYEEMCQYYSISYGKCKDLIVLFDGVFQEMYKVSQNNKYELFVEETDICVYNVHKISDTLLDLLGLDETEFKLKITLYLSEKS